MWIQSVQYDLQHDFAWVIDEAYCSVVLALLQVAFLGKCDVYGPNTLVQTFLQCLVLTQAQRILSPGQDKGHNK